MNEENNNSSDLNINNLEGNPSNVNDNSKFNQFAKKFTFHIKTIAVLSITILFFLILTVFSYTRSDINESSITLKDLYGLIQKNPEIMARQATTHNWLGLLGAFLSNELVNGTFGYPVILLLGALIYIFFDIFKYSFITAKKLKNTFFIIILMVLLSGFLSTLQRFTWLGTIPFEWGGLVGYFLANVISSFLGDFGAFFLFLLAITLSIFYKLNFKISDISVYLFSRLKDIFAKKKNETKIDEENIQQPSTDLTQKNETISEIDSNIVLTQNNSMPINEIEVSDNEADIFKSVLVNETLENKNPVSANLPKTDPADIAPSSFANKSENPFKKSFNITINDIQPKEPQNLSITEKFVPKIREIDPSKISISNEQIQKELENESKSNATNEIVELNQSNTESNFSKKEIKEIKEIEQSPLENVSSFEIQLPKSSPKAENIANLRTEDDVQLNKIETKVANPLNLVIEAEPKEEKTLKSLIYQEHHVETINYTFPKLDFLIKQTTQSVVDKGELELNGRILQEKLETFKIVIDNLSITPGPVVTQYEFVPAPGIKISKIESLADDLAMALKAKGIRIIAPIPGKGTIGVEIPNSNPQIVRFSEIVASERFQKTEAKLPLAFGKTINGEVFIGDLTKMPHLLIAGSTGSGKSVGINTIISSLLYKIHPDKLKFIIIDPKKVELAQYSQLGQHYLATSPDLDDLIVTNPKDAVMILKSAVLEMERRYDILADAGQRNIHDYNEKVKDGQIRKSEKMEHHQIPYIVVIIDELADLMLTASKEIEEPIIRLAQMARAVGIHLVLATQRPSVDVITGIIKANFPARIAYLVASRIDSRTILDQQGAEQLLGNGDMLILPPGSPKPIRVQNAFISTDEVEQICDFIGNQEGYSEPYMLPSSDENNDELKDIDPSDRDPLFEEAARLIISMQQASVSMLQRKMKIGYARAGRIMDELEATGIVGSAKGSKAREVLLDSESQLEAYL
jgi:S-DNA-T family DNA segregation ATPase FtsK/SpoIIIE